MAKLKESRIEFRVVKTLRRLGYEYARGQKIVRRSKKEFLIL
ncbi:hypothetical protein OVS_02480 [Mycoplasma ovis str. Michigan]|uniref:Uncharacterized protein n=1 Tax=Mycoplasma ovis str. Michigan TaxID=1415773 RepID=A0ABM5P1H1_9MOLU|nr:hypothetical protein OVS_02480 [Mycoplasma ovis str. Michigan]